MASEPQSVCRVGVFIDWQNCYRTARDAFGFTGSGIDGNIKPALLCRALAHDRLDTSVPGELVKVRIYTGRASQHHDKRTYAANRRQFAAWESADDRIQVIARTLDYKLGRAREKGIDVQIAIDLVRTTLFENEHEVAVLVSADTDLLPALELIARRAGPHAIEVATWTGPYWAPQPLSIAGHKIRQHLMSEAVYRKVADDRDYNVDSGPSGPTLPFGRRRR